VLGWLQADLMDLYFQEHAQRALISSSTSTTPIVRLPLLDFRLRCLTVRELHLYPSATELAHTQAVFLDSLFPHSAVALHYS